MLDPLLTRQEVEKHLGLSRSALYANLRRGALPLPIKIGPRAIRWRQSELEAWLSERPRARGVDTADS